MDRRIRDYIHNNRERYTREAIRSKLIGAGHDPSAIDQALQEVWSEPGRLQAEGGGTAGQVHTAGRSTRDDPIDAPHGGR